jgi:hypothetical protein
MLKHLNSALVLQLYRPELDQLVLLEVQKQHFELFLGPKRIYVAGRRTHLDVLKGQTAPGLTKLQIGFT